jgi:hypothetical protein
LGPRSVQMFVPRHKRKLSMYLQQASAEPMSCISRRPDSVHVRTWTLANTVPGTVPGRLCFVVHSLSRRAHCRASRRAHPRPIPPAIPAD